MIGFKRLTLAAAIAVALTGCGTDGKDGAPGENGFIGQSVNGATSQLTPMITNVQFDSNGIATIDFEVTDANGVALVGLDTKDIAGLSIGRIGNEEELGLEDIKGEGRDIWVSYFNKSKGIVAGEELVAGSGYFSGLAYGYKDINCVDCLTDHGDGTYTLVTSGKKPSGEDYTVAINALGLIKYQGDLTHGAYLSIKVRDDQPDSDGVYQAKHLADGRYINGAGYYYWQPDSNTEESRPKHVILNENCETCHRPDHNGNLGNMHHPGKHETMDSCTFCHVEYNQYIGEDEDGNAFAYDGSIKGLAHEIHVHSFYEEGGIYPQTAANCQTCHVPNKTAQADAWMADLDTATCQNCHGLAHGENEKYQNCVECHSSTGYARGASAAHYDENARINAANFKVNFENVVVAADQSALTVTLSVLDGETKLPLSMIDSTDYKYSGKTSAIIINSIKDNEFVTNYQKVGVAETGIGTEPTYAVAESDNSITVTIPATDFDLATILAEGNILALSSQLHVCQKKSKDASGAFAVQPVICEYDETDTSGKGKLAEKMQAPYVVSDTQYFHLDGTPVAENKTPRQQYATMEACLQCHTTEIYHRYTNDLDGCASCHNDTRDKKSKGSSNLAYITHGKHYIFGSNGLFFKKTDCQACHGDNGFSLDATAQSVVPVAFNKDVDDNKLYISPQAAACISCHTYGLNSTVKAHMEQYGAELGDELRDLDQDGKFYPSGVEFEKAAAAKETCSVCHNASNLLEVHANFGNSH